MRDHPTGPQKFYMTGSFIGGTNILKCWVMLHEQVFQQRSVSHSCGLSAQVSLYTTLITNLSIGNRMTALALKQWQKAVNVNI